MSAGSRFVLMYLIVLVYAVPGLGQERVFSARHYGVEEGLPHRNTQLVFFDRDGIGWAATSSALTRIDGDTRYVYGREELGEAVNNITAISQDALGRMWLWGRMGCYIFDPYTREARTAVEALGVSEEFAEAYLNKAPLYPLRRKNGELIFNPGGRAVIVKVDTEGKLTTRKSSLPAPFQLLATGETEASIWARSQNEIGRLDHQGDFIFSHRHSSISVVRPTALVDDTLYYYLIRRSDKSPFHFFQQNGSGVTTNLLQTWGVSEIRRVYFEPGQHMFWLERDMVWEIRDMNGRLTREIKFLPENALLHTNINNSWMATSDHCGALWIAAENGLTRLESSTSRFKKHFFYAENWVETERYSIRGIWAAGDTVLAGAELDGMLLETKEERKKLAEEYAYYSAGKNIPTTFNAELMADYRAVFRSREGQFWLGHQRVVLRYDPVLDNYTLFPPNFEYQVGAGIGPWCFYEHTDGKIWVGLQKGIAYITPKSDSLELLDPSEKFAALSEATVYTIHESETDILWLATSQGLFKLSAQGEVLEHYWSGGDQKYLLPFDIIYHLFPAGDGKFWLATSGAGLILFDPQDGSTRQWGRESGLSDQIIYAVYETEDQLLWLTSDYGLMRLDTASNMTTTWLPEDGLPDSEFNRIAHFRADDGRFYFGTINGMVSFLPADLADWEDTVAPPIRITRYSVWKAGEPLPEDRTAQLLVDSTILLKPSHNQFYLEFSLTDYSVDEIDYSFRIANEDWQQLNSNSIRTGRLPYGSYNLEVRGQLPSGKWTENNLRLTIQVLRPFYLLPIFWIGIIALLIGLIMLYLRIRTEQLLRRQKELEESISAATVQIRKDKALIEEQAEELRELDQVKTRFFANVSHELRTPLTLILGPLRSLLKSSENTQKEESYLKLAEQNANELLQKINGILDLSKLDAKGLVLKTVPTRLYEMIRRTLGNFESRADLQKIRLVYDYGGDRSLTFELDEEKITTIINNLLANALRFTPAGGQILLSVTDATNLVRIAVRDTGIGIAEADLPFVFDRFFQAGQGGKIAGGSGIGLSLCRELAELHGGNIRVESRIGQGTTFTVELPRREVLGLSLMEGEEQKNYAKPSPALIKTSGETVRRNDLPRILIVEDNTSVQTYLATILQQDYEVLTAINGRFGLEKLQNSTFLPALIITDLMMPEMDGFEFIEKIKSEETTRRIPVIVLTARSTVDDRLRALRYGVDDYVGKPFVEEELVARIRRLLINAQERSGASNEATKSENAELDQASEWLVEIENFILQELENKQLTASLVADFCFLSVRQLQRRLKKEVGLSTGEYIREIRLNEALRLLVSKELTTVKGVSHRVGFQRVEYFSTRFKERFGLPPSSYL